MTDKQRLFADEYLKGMNATKAYLSVYKNVKNEHVARTLASRLLTKVDIKSYVQKRLDEMSNEKIADAKEVMEYLTSVMRGKSKSSVLSLSEDGGQNIVEKPPDEKEKLKAAELLSKRYNMFDDVNKERLKLEREKFEFEKEQKTSGQDDALSKLDELIGSINKAVDSNGTDS